MIRPYYMGVVMLRKIVTVAILAAVAGVTVAQAQTVAQIGGPAELPPSSFKGQMYVDSRGCVFLRAGLSGRTNWVPRVSRDRKALCGYPPTLAAMANPVPVAEAPAVTVAEAPAPRATGKPLNTVATLTTPPKIRMTPPAGAMTAEPYMTRAVPAAIAAPPAVVMAQAPRVAVQPPVTRAPEPILGPVQTGLTGGKIGCYTSAPVPKLVSLSNGGTAVLCTRGDGTLAGARAPLYAKVAMGEGNRVGAGLYDPAGTRVSRGNMSVDAVGSADRATIVTTYAAAPEPIVMPKGYKAAWTDDRLNPYRAQGTAQGRAQQDQLWTREVPSNLVAAQGTVVRRVAVSTKGTAPRVQISTKSEPTARVAKPATKGSFYVQVGTFGVASNAEGARAQLRAAGLPVGTAKISKGGKPMQMVMAGPFADSAAAQMALRAARGVGFGDAFIR